MDVPDISSQPGTIETAYAVLAAAVSLIVGIGGTIAAFLKVGVKSGTSPKNIHSLPAPEGWSEMRMEIKSLIERQKLTMERLERAVGDSGEALKIISSWNDQMQILFSRVSFITEAHNNHERLVHELHKALLEPELTVQRRLQKEKIEEMLIIVRQLKADQDSISRGVKSTAEATSTIAIRLKEMSQ